MTGSPDPRPQVEHLQGLEALPRVAETLERFEPAVLMTADGRGAIYASSTGSAGPGNHFWLLADARSAIDWEATRHQELTLTFQSRDERVYLQLTGMAQLVTEPGVAGAIWRQSFSRWFPGGASDPKLLLVLFTASAVEFFEIASGRISPPLPN